MDNFLSNEIDISTLQPPTVKNLKEFEEIAKVENTNFNEARLNINTLFTTRFVHETDEMGISLWEKMLKINPAKDESLEFRRKRVLSRIQANQPYTMRYLKRLLASLLGEDGYQVNLDIVNEHLDVLVKFDSSILGSNIQKLYNELSDLLDKIVPLNLSLGITNRRNIEMPLTFGGIISERRKITLQPMKFTMPTLNLTKYRAGFISVRNKTTINAEV